MTGIEYMNTVCPTTSAGRDPNREDVADAFEDGIAEGYKHHWKPSKEQMKALKLAYEDAFECPEGGVPHLALAELYEQLKQL